MKTQKTQKTTDLDDGRQHVETTWADGTITLDMYQHGRHIAYLILVWGGK
jgi:hypothetical protein